MTNETVEKAKADVKKGIADAGKAGAYVKADAKAEAEKVKAKFGPDDELGKKAAYAKADIKADAEKAEADVDNKITMQKLMRRKRKPT